MDYILVVDDDEKLARSTALLLREVIDEPFDVVHVTSYDAARRALQRPGLHALLTDHRLGCERTGLDLLREAARRHPDAARVLMSGDLREELPVEAELAGAHAFLGKPFRPAEVVPLLLAKPGTLRGAHGTRAPNGL